MTPLAESPGTIALPSAEIGRFAVFTVAIAGTQQPHGTYLNTMCSVDVTENLNTIIRNLRPEDRWVWFIGDDHVWPGDTLVTMLETLDKHPEIDVLVPLVVKRNPPWHLVVFWDTDEVDELGNPQYQPLRWDEIPETGVFEVHAAGSAGMLVRREVLDTLGDPWFYSTFDDKGRRTNLNEDVLFCTRVRQAGFRLFATADCTMGHLGIFNVRPLFRDGAWGALTEFSSAESQFRHLYMPVVNEVPTL